MEIDPHTHVGTYKSYALGYFVCLLLTFAAYFALTQHLISSSFTASLIIACGVFQIIVQLILFVHLNVESKPRWNLLVFLFTLLIAAIIVIGSLWIMANLDYRMMSPP